MVATRGDEGAGPDVATASGCEGGSSLSVAEQIRAKLQGVHAGPRRDRYRGYLSENSFLIGRHGTMTADSLGSAVLHSACCLIWQEGESLICEGKGPA